MMSSDLVLGVLTLLLSILIAEAGTIAWIIGQNSKLRLEIKKDQDAANAKEALDIGALRQEFGIRFDGLEARESKARHDLSNRVQESILLQQQQLNSIRDGGATKTELGAVESRLTAALADLKTDTRVELGKITTKLDQLPAISAQVSAMSVALEKIGDHLSLRNSV